MQKGRLFCCAKKDRITIILYRYLIQNYYTSFAQKSLLYCMNEDAEGKRRMENIHTMSALLDELTECACCTYLSDLHAAAYRSAVCDVVTGVPASAYPARVWNDVARYILGRSIPQDTADKTRAYLISMLKN